MEQSKQSQKWPLILFTIGVFMAGLDNGIISAALTTIYNSFGVSPAWGAWTVTLYTLGIAISVPIIGKLSDNYGRKRLFIIEIIIFGIGSLLVALSPNFTILLIARFIQAIGGGGIFIIASAHVLATMPKQHQGKALGLIGGMHGIAAVVGPNIGALILRATGSWEWMFYINIPIAIFLVIMGIFKLEESKQPTPLKLDMRGTVLLTLTIVSFMLGITNIDSENLMQSITGMGVLPFIIIGLISVLTFLIHERNLEGRGGDPIIAYSLLQKQGFRLTLLLGLFSGGFLATIIFIPSYVQQVLQVAPENAGFWLTPLALASGIGAGLGGFLTDKIGAKRTILVSGFIGFSGFLLFHTFVDGFFMFFVASMLAGIGLGFLLGAPLNVLVGESVEDGQYGTSLGTLSLFRQVGLTLFPTLFASFITTGVINIEPTFKTMFNDPVINFTGVDKGEGYDVVIKEIEQLADPSLQNKLLTIVADVMRSGFQNMFFTAMIIAIVVALISGYLLIKAKKINKKQ